MTYRQKTERREGGSGILKPVSRHTDKVLGLGGILANEFRTMMESDHMAQRGELEKMGMQSQI